MIVCSDLVIVCSDLDRARESRSGKRRRHRLAALVSSLLLVIASQVHAQPMGLPSMGAASPELTPEVEQEIGDVIMAKGRLDPTYIGDAEVRQYFTDLARRLAVHSPGRIPHLEVFAVNDPGINAFSMPGGYIGVNTGLVLATGSESELAAVVAHEIGHQVQDHVARGLSESRQNGALMLATLAAAVAAGLAGGGDLGVGVASFGTAATVERQLRFSRDAEREADRVGLIMLVGAGFDPNGMVRMFQNLMRYSQFDAPTDGADVSDHPETMDRLSDIQNRVRNLPPSHYADRPDYWFLRAKLRTIQDASGSVAQTAQQILSDGSHTHTGVQQAADNYGLALMAHNRRQPAQAQQYLVQARQAGVQAPELDTLAITLAFEQKNTAQALSLARAAWTRWPDSWAVGEALGQALSDSGDTAGAMNLYRSLAARWGEDEPEFYRRLADLEVSRGLGVQGRRDMATYYVHVGALPAAVSQLQQAQAMSKDFYEQSELDVEIGKVHKLLAAQKALIKEFGS